VGRAEQQRRQHRREPQADDWLQDPDQETPEQQFLAEARLQKPAVSEPPENAGNSDAVRGLIAATLPS
jgi:hypothetical protein